MLEKSDLPQGTLDLLILKVVALGPVHGYAIAQRLEQVSRGVFQIPQGSLYPALHRLEKQKWIGAEWKVSENKQDVKVYKLTAAGRKRLTQERTRWEQITDAIGGVLNPAKKESQP
jgi:transcriptional regulator